MSRSRWLVVAAVAAQLLAARTASSDSAAADSAGVHSLIAAVIDAYGGRAALDKVHAVRIDAMVTPAGRDSAVTMTRLFERPNRLRVRIDYPARPEIRVVDGDRGWRSGAHAAADSAGTTPTALAEAKGQALGAMQLQAARADLPWILLEREASASLAPPDSAATTNPRTTTLDVALGGDLRLEVVVDPATHRIVESRGVFGGGDAATTFATRYSDYRRVGHVWFAFRESNFAGDVHTADIAFRRVTLDPKLDAVTFTSRP
jgi:hypothetical protein